MFNWVGFCVYTLKMEPFPLSSPPYPQVIPTLSRGVVDKKSFVAILTATTNVKHHPNFKAESLITRPFSCFEVLRLKGGIFVSTEMSERSFVSADTERV